MAHYAVSAIGRDRPGITAGLTEALLELDANIEDSRMTILRGHFAVMLVVSIPGDRDPASVEERMAEAADELGLEALSASPIDELDDAAADPSLVISVYGADHPGIVHAVTTTLAERGANITDLQTQLAGSENERLYMMLLEVAPGEGTVEQIEQDLSEVAERAQVEISVRPLEVEAL